VKTTLCRLAALLLFGLLLVPAAPVPAAVGPDEILADPELEARARALGRQLRCLVCQNQSIDDSDAELARDIRRLVREQLLAGKSEGEIIAYLTARYGDFILLKPPVKPRTWLLWAGPFLVLATGAAGVALWLRRRRGAEEGEPELDPEEEARLASLLESREPRSS